MAVSVSSFQRVKLYVATAVLVAALVIMSFMDANYGDVDPIKYTLMLFVGGVSAAAFVFGAFLHPNGAKRRTAKTLLWGAASGLVIVGLLHLPPNSIPEGFRHLSRANAKTAVDYAVGIAITGVTFALAFALWRFSDE